MTNQNKHTTIFEEINSMIGDNQYATFHCECIDCGKKFDIEIERTSETSLNITGGIMAKNTNSKLGPMEWMFKCMECYQLEPLFIGGNEVYSRVVGYLRPIKMWNNAKQEEYKLRKEYKFDEDGIMIDTKNKEDN